MDPTASIAFWAILFLGSHMVISSDLVRPRLIAAIGEQPYRGIYSLVAFATLIPFIVVFGHHKHSGPMLWYLRDVGPARGLTRLLMLASLIFLSAGLINPSPNAVSISAPTSPRPPRGILKATRHPTLVAFSLFGLAHLLMNGWLGDIFFFGCFPALGIFGGVHQDRRKIRELGDAYRDFLAATSFFPGIALMSGRQRWSRSDTPWTAIAIGIVLTIVIVIIHPRAFGGNPLG